MFRITRRASIEAPIEFVFDCLTDLDFDDGVDIYDLEYAIRDDPLRRRIREGDVVLAVLNKPPSGFAHLNGEPGRIPPMPTLTSTVVVVSQPTWLETSLVVEVPGARTFRMKVVNELSGSLSSTDRRLTITLHTWNPLFGFLFFLEDFKQRKNVAKFKAAVEAKYRERAESLLNPEGTGPTGC